MPVHPVLALVVAMFTLVLAMPGTAARAVDPPPPAAGAGGAVTAGAPWMWPLADSRVLVPYDAPAHRYGPGHRGVDMRAHAGDVVRAPASGIVAFSGVVVDRGVITIDHGDGWVSTLEPVLEAVPAGTTVAAGDPLARVGRGGHAPPGAVHFGVRHEGEYINPQLLFGPVPRAVLLPCC